MYALIHNIKFNKIILREFFDVKLLIIKFISRDYFYSKSKVNLVNKLNYTDKSKTKHDLKNRVTQLKIL